MLESREGQLWEPIRKFHSSSYSRIHILVCCCLCDISRSGLKLTVIFLRIVYESWVWALYTRHFVTSTWTLCDRLFVYMNLWTTPSYRYYRSIITCNWNYFCLCFYFFRRGPSRIFCKALQSCSKSICWTIENEICMYKMLYFCMNRNAIFFQWKKWHTPKMINQSHFVACGILYFWLRIKYNKFGSF